MLKYWDIQFRLFARKRLNHSFAFLTFDSAAIVKFAIAFVFDYVHCPFVSSVAAELKKMREA